MINESVGQRTTIDSNEEFRLHAYLPVMDCLICELERRFSDAASTVMIGVHALTPKHPSFCKRKSSTLLLNYIVVMLRMLVMRYIR